MINFDNEKMTEALKCGLIIAQYEEKMKELIPGIADDFGVSKAIAKKIIKAYCVDTLEKTQEKLEDERASLVNAEIMIEAIENVTVDLADTEYEAATEDHPNGSIISDED